MGISSLSPGPGIWNRRFSLGLILLLGVIPGGCDRPVDGIHDPAEGGAGSAKNSGEAVGETPLLSRNTSEVRPEKIPAFREGRRVPGSLIIGLDADLSSGSARAGESIRRGAILAIEEINSRGGLLGRPVELVVRDHRGNPDRGVDHVEEFATRMDDVLAVLGGLHTPVALRELDAIHEHEMLFLVPWAAGTPVVDHGRQPDYVFRVSVRDEYAGGFLVRKALERGATRPGLLLERTGWGRSNLTAITNALAEQGQESPPVAWFNWGETDMNSQLDQLLGSGVDLILLVSNPPEGAAFVRSLAARPAPERVPVISHWGITGADFPGLVPDALSLVDLTFLQTSSFIRPRHPDRVQPVLERYRERFCDGLADCEVISPPGTAHAYEIVQMLAAAVREAGTIRRPAVREALESLKSYRGILRDHDRPFPPGHHDALDETDFILARFSGSGSIEPVD